VTLSCNPQSTQAVNVLKNGLRPAAHAASPSLTALIGRGGVARARGRPSAGG
jgi:hypothetical protein